MPTYSYACTNCDDRFDAVQAFTDDALSTCAKCDGKLRKLFGSVGVVFKGSGFYRNDSRAAGSNTGSTAAKAEKPGGESSSAKESPKKESPKSDSKKSDSSPAKASAAAGS